MVEIFNFYTETKLNHINKQADLKSSECKQQPDMMKNLEKQILSQADQDTF